MSRYAPPITAYQDFSCFQRKPTAYPWEASTTRFVVDPQRRIDWVPSIEDVQNSYGCIRWFKIRELYFNQLVDLDFCVEAFQTWRDTREDLWLDAVGTNGDIIGSAFVVAAKRGNKWYKERINFKFSFFEKLPPITFFGDDWGLKSTPMLFVTLTVDPDLCGNDLNQAWDGIADELHLFETKLRQKYGRFVKLRVWESHLSGYPHAHIVYYFLNHEFEVWENIVIDEDGSIKQTWRVSDADRDIIQSFWGMAHPIKVIDGISKRVPSVDIQGVQDTLGALSEVRKYVTKTIWSDKGDLTNTLCCLFNKQVYWLSQCDYMQKKMPDEIAAIRSNNPFRDAAEREAATQKYVDDNISAWAKKDFIGAVWGVDAYRWFYEELHKHGFDEGMSEPDACALVSQTLHNCNKELPDFDHFEFKGAFLHSDLKVLLALSDDPTAVVDPPPDDVRLYFGVDRVILSGGSGSKMRRSFGVDPDREDDF